jgi:hypothetical protein
MQGNQGNQLQLLVGVEVAIRLQPLLDVRAVPLQPMSFGADGIQALSHSAVVALRLVSYTILQFRRFLVYRCQKSIPWCPSGRKMLRPA